MRKPLLWLLLAVLAAPATTFAQGMLIDNRDGVRARLPQVAVIDRRLIRPIPQPQPQTSYKIKELAVDVNLTDQIAKVQVSQSFVNTGNRQMEVSFVFPLPYDGAVDQLTFMVDGKEYEAKLLSASEARNIYEGYMRRNLDPALMEWMGVGMFKTSVFPVPAGAERKVTLRYNQICRKASGLTEFAFPLSTAKFTDKPVEKVAFRLNIQSRAPIKNVYSPTHSVEVKRPTNMQAVISHETANEVPNSDFRLLYDVGDAKLGASILTYRPDVGEDGYFLLLLSPEIKDPSTQSQKKSVVFVVDRSGSMSGKKMDQAKGALRFVLNNLNEGDLFNIIAYDSVVESFRPELQKYNDQTRKEALGFVEGVYAGGSTNIDGALKSALSHLKDQERPGYVIFLTDGLPTAGETAAQKIAANAKETNQTRARIFTFGVGYDVNSRLLDKLSRAGFGRSEYVSPKEDIEEKVSKLYNRIGAPAMTDVELNVDVENWKPEQGKPVNRVYPRDAYDIFQGDQLVLVGRYKEPGDAKIVVTGKVDGAQQSEDFPAKLTDSSADQTYAFIEKLWALRRVGELIDDIDLNGKTDEVVNELVTLSTKHGIITPYTSFLAEEPGLTAQPNGVANFRRRADLQLERLNAQAGQDAFAQRKLKAEFQFADRAQAAGAPPVAAALGDEKRTKELEEAAARNVNNVGAKTFYRQGLRWVDAKIADKPEAQAPENAKNIERFSKEYFDLAFKHGKRASQYLALEGEVVFELDGQVYYVK